MENSFYLDYVIALDREGFVYREQISREVSTLPKPGEKIRDFYDDEITFYNVGKCAHLEWDDKEPNHSVYQGQDLIVVTPEVVQETIKELLQKYFSQVVAANSQNINQDSMGTAFKEFFNVQRDTVTNFSVEDYLSVQNTLIVYSEMVSPLMSKFIHKTITSANTLLAADGIIPHNGNGQAFFYTCDDNAVKQLNTELAAYRLEKLSVDYRELKGKTTKMRL